MGDEGIPLQSITNNCLTESHTPFDEGLPLSNSYINNVKKHDGKKQVKLRYKPLILLFLTISNGTFVYAKTDNNFSNIDISPTTITLHQPLTITARFEKTTDENDLHWLQVSDKSTNSHIARNNVSYNLNSYHVFVDISDKFITYILQILNVTFKDLQEKYRVEYGTKTISFELMKWRKLIVKPERLRKEFYIENGTLIGTINLFNMYPYPTGYGITFQTPEGDVFPFNGTFQKGSGNKVFNLVNATSDVKEPLLQNICSGNLSITIFLGDISITTFNDHISTNCSAGHDSNYTETADTILPLIIVLSVCVGICVFVLVIKFRRKLKPLCAPDSIPMSYIKNLVALETDHGMKPEGDPFI